VGAVATFAAASAPAATLTASQILTQFNSVVSGDFSTAHDVEGRLVANNLVKGATFYNNPSNTPSAFSAVNAINIGANGGGNINNGGSVNYVTSNAGSFNLNGSGGSIKHGVPTFSMADFTTPLNALESQLAGLSNTNGTLNAADPNNFTFNLTGNASSTSVFNLTTSQLGSAANINFSGTASTVVINVRYSGTVGARPEGIQHQRQLQRQFPSGDPYHLELCRYHASELPWLVWHRAGWHLDGHQHLGHEWFPVRRQLCGRWRTA
jgi:hypothetical protein